MYCPKCETRAQCIDSRDCAERKRRRRYKCPSKTCGHRFTTIEVSVDKFFEIDETAKKIKKLMDLIKKLGWTDK